MQSRSLWRPRLKIRESTSALLPFYGSKKSSGVAATQRHTGVGTQTQKIALKSEGRCWEEGQGGREAGFRAREALNVTTEARWDGTLWNFDIGIVLLLLGCERSRDLHHES